ncbi:MAG: AAA family ATPase [Alphaproteobacteria bacterium]|jgi:DNA polymerase III delta' subunit|nr:AAA family ATPase [Candidatus Jidaibacter sp.]
MTHKHPRFCSTVYGHSKPTKAFLDALQSNKMHHAWIIAGSKGIGKSSLCYKLAKLLLSSPESQQNATTECTADTFASKHVENCSHPDLMVAQNFKDDVPYNESEIKIDDIRNLTSSLNMTAALGKNKVVIIDSADSLNNNAANALLKALEEPTKNTYFFLIANNAGRLLPTIKSRCRTLKLTNLSSDDFELAARSIGINNADINFLYDFTNGSLYFSELLYNSADFKNVKDIFSQQSVEQIISQLPSLSQFSFEQHHMQFVIEKFFNIIIKANVGNPYKIASLFEWKEDFSKMMRETEIFNLDWKNVYLTAIEKLPS